MKRWLVAIVSLVALLVYAHRRGERHLQLVARSGLVATPAPHAAGDVERGRQLVHDVHRCDDCHGAALAGEAWVDLPLVGRFGAPSLAGGRPPWVADRAIRHGRDATGRPLVGMPSDRYASLSPSDLRDVVAYLASLPAVEQPFTSSPPGPVLVMAVGLGALSAATRERGSPAMQEGERLAATWGCIGCHQDGARSSETSPPRLDAASLESWSVADFRRAVREGLRPDGRLLSTRMPSAAFQSLGDDELDAIHRYFVGGG
ncbi:MAG: cytochrome c [Polyangiaceae bacterium]